MRGYIIVNPFKEPKACVRQAERLKNEFEKKGVSVKIVFDAYLHSGLRNGNLTTDYRDCDFCVYLDKDKYASSVLEKNGIRLFNSHAAVRVCDDKGETYIALAGSGLNIPDTVFGALCYRGDVATDTEAAQVVADKLGLPLVVKESFGSLGSGVYLVKTVDELSSLTERIKLKPHLFQKYMGSRKGTDVRIIVVGGRAVAAMERRNDCDFRSNISSGGTGRAVVPSSAFIKAAEKAASVLGLDYCGVDLLYGDDGEPYVCEVNSNAFFEEMERVTGINVAEAYVEEIIKQCGNMPEKQI